jgi:hypothetical protein
MAASSVLAIFVLKDRASLLTACAVGLLVGLAM